MNDITALAQREMEQREKFEAWTEESCALPWGYLKKRRTYDGFYSEHTYTSLWAAWKAASMALVEALEKAQQSVELVDLQRDKLKRLESDLWDKEQLRKVHSEKSFELEGKVRELEARNQKDFVWRGKEIDRLNDEVDELKEKLESRTVTVKLPKRSVGEVMHMSGFSRDYAEGWCSGNDNAINEMKLAGIQVIEGEGQ